MARRSQAILFRHSVWDRLLNPNGLRGEGVGVSMAGEVERLKDAVHEDLKQLLSSRRPFININNGDPYVLPEGMPDLENSLMAFGLPDFTGMTMGDALEHDRLKTTLETLIQNFEPRLSGVAVSFKAEDQDRSRPSLHYRIEGMLRLDPIPEPIAFNTTIDLGNMTITVKREGG